MIRRVAAALLVTVGFVTPSAGQSASSSLEDARARRLPTLEQIKLELASARFSLGPIRILPRLEIRELGYVSNVFGSVFGSAGKPEPDETAQVAAGVRAILPIGRKTYVLADALPEYVYYLHHSELRDLNGRYGGQLLGLFNRLGVNIGAYTDRTREYLSSEVFLPVNRRVDGGSAEMEVEFLKRLGLALSYRDDRIRYLAVGRSSPLTLPSASDLDRREGTARGGLRYHFTERVSLEGFVEESRTDFTGQRSPRNNRSRAYLLGLHYDRPRFYVDLTGGYRKVEPRAGGDFPEFSGLSGSVFSSYALALPGRWLAVMAYAHRGINYALYQNISYYREEVLGGGPELRIGARARISFFGETGRNVYPVPVVPGGQSIVRADRIRSWGGQMSIDLSRALVLGVRVSDTRYNSNVAGFDRTIFRVSSTVSLNGDILR